AEPSLIDRLQDLPANPAEAVDSYSNRHQVPPLDTWALRDAARVVAGRINRIEPCGNRRSPGSAAIPKVGLRRFHDYTWPSGASAPLSRKARAVATSCG